MKQFSANATSAVIIFLSLILFEILLQMNVGAPCPSFIRVGAAGYLFPVSFQSEVESIYKMKVKSTDTYVIAFPRSGKFRNSVWNMVSVKERGIGISDEDGASQKFNQYVVPLNEMLETTPDPRFLKTHLPLSVLPPNLIDTSKVVYVARNPRDVAVSSYHLSRLLLVSHYQGDFKTFWKMFMHDNMIRSPYFAHVKEAWDLRNHPNMLFLFYEELSKDLPSVIKRTAKFFNKKYTDEQIFGLCKHLHIENFRKNDSVNLNFLASDKTIETKDQPFIRKGKVGDWQEYFDEEMTTESENWIRENLTKTGIQFPALPE